MEDYAAKMASKTDAELQRYLTHRAEYRDDAVLAALAELERRGQAVPGAAGLRTELEAAVQRAAAEAPAPVPPPWARPAAEDEEEPEAAQGPELYTPSTIAIYSAVFSFIVGGVLLLLNLLRLRRYGGAALLLVLVILAVWGVSWAVSYFEVRPQYVLLGVNFVLALLYVYLVWPYFIGPQTYRPRSWLTPLLVVLALQLVLGMLYYYLGNLTGGQ